MELHPQEHDCRELHKAISETWGEYMEAIKAAGAVV